MSAIRKQDEMMTQWGGRRRIVIENIGPEVDTGRFPIKRVVGEKVVVTADIYADGHDVVAAKVLYRRQGDREWNRVPMQALENDRWMGAFVVDQMGIYHYRLEGWVDHFKTWQQDLKKRLNAGTISETDKLIGARLIEEASERASNQDRQALSTFTEILKKADKEEVVSIAFGEELTDLMTEYPDKKFAVSYETEFAVVVDSNKALFSTWYELFPRSCSPEPGRHGTFKDCERLLPDIARMGFDTLYIPPIHPIGKTNRKGKNNSLQVESDDVGSPWAIGAEEGGHKAVDPQLGTLDDFAGLIKSAKKQGLEVAMDLAFQCSPDHPYAKEHPEWFTWRPDGTIQYAENPPK
ncbi:MAG TPA: maltotransferase domain-containing protein, partial [Syntrophorhabdales bacterium]|nr:maltotransferase domain-containing protein [Syntrophorhabdales bacterium]